VLHAEVAENPDRLRRFHREVEAAGSVSHPNILAIYVGGAQGGMPYIVSEFLQGETRARLHGDVHFTRLPRFARPTSKAWLGGFRSGRGPAADRSELKRITSAQAVYNSKTVRSRRWRPKKQILFNARRIPQLFD
jgi:serine/threonine protein kinase